MRYIVLLIPVIFQWRMEGFNGDDTGTCAGILQK